MNDNVQEMPESPFANETVEEPIDTEEGAEDEIQEELIEEDEDLSEEDELFEELFEDEDDLSEDEDDLSEDEDDLSEDEDDLSEDEIDELLDSLEYDDEEPEDEPDMVPHGALHKERARRKEAQQNLQDLNNELAESNASIEEYEKAFEDMKAQLKELDLLDVVKLNEPAKKDPKLIELEQQQRQAKANEQSVAMIQDVRNEASQFIDEYKQIDKEDAGHAEIIVGLALANMAFGLEQEDAVTHAMDVFNKSLAVKHKESLRQRKPVQRQKKPSVRKRTQARKLKIEPGNVSSIFQKMANDAYE